MSDLNGFYELKDTPLTKVGIFPYSGSQIDASGEYGLDPSKVYLVYRSEEELRKDECVESFKLIPWVDDHVMIGPREEGLTPAEEKGVEGVIGEDVYFKDGYLLGNVKIFSQNLADKVKNGKNQLSIGYRCKYIKQSGTYANQMFDFVQTELRGNHLALVKEGRAGPDVSVTLDHFLISMDGLSMAEKEMLNKDEELEISENQEMTPDEETETSSEPSMEQKINEMSQKIASIMASLEKLQLLEKQEQEETASDEDKEEKDKQMTSDQDDEEKKEKESNSMDSRLLKVLYKDIPKRDMLAKKLSNVIGTFDHSEKTLQEVAVYGVKKLNLNCPKGHEVALLEGYFNGVQAGMDSKLQGVHVENAANRKKNEMDDFLAKIKG